MLQSPFQIRKEESSHGICEASGPSLVGTNSCSTDTPGSRCCSQTGRPHLSQSVYPSSFSKPRRNSFCHVGEVCVGGQLRGGCRSSLERGLALLVFLTGWQPPVQENCTVRARNSLHLHSKQKTKPLGGRHVR